MKYLKLYEEGEKPDGLYLPGIAVVVEDDEDKVVYAKKNNKIVSDIPTELYKEGDKFVTDAENRLTVGDNSLEQTPYNTIEVSNIGI